MNGSLFIQGFKTLTTGQKTKIFSDIEFIAKAPNGKIYNLDYALTATGGTGATAGFTNTIISSIGTAALSSGTSPFTATFKAEPIATTYENLKAAIEAEINQHTSLFAEYEQSAWNEGFKKVATKIKLFRQIKRFYAERFEKLAANFDSDSVFKKDKEVKWICRKCGFIYESDRALKNCPGCEHPQAYFEILAENY